MIEDDPEIPMSIILGHRGLSAHHPENTMEAFRAALAAGMPPSGGIALGVDRLVMALTGKTTLDEVIPFREIV